MNYKFNIISIVLALMCAMGYATQCAAGNRVLIIHSFHAEFDWVRGINSALEPLLKTANTDYRFSYMDTKRKSDFAWKLKRAQQARQLIHDYAPKIVIAVDDVAQAYVARNFAGSSPIQFIFAGVNAEPDFYGYPAANVTGILERTYPAQALNMLKMIMPTLEKTVWISDDSATANLVLSRVRHKADKGQLPVPIASFLQPTTFDQWKAKIRQINANGLIGSLLIPLYHTVKTHIEGQSVPPTEVMSWTVANTSKPIIGFWPFSTDDGAVCSVVVDPKEHGRVAGLMARQIMAGKKAGDIPMVVNKNGYVIINLVAATRLGIDVPFEVMLSADKIIE